MTRRIVSKLALATQLLSASAGLCLAAQAPQTTPDSQKNNKEDRELTQKIRKAVVADKTLSTSAHNVKIISQNGTVTLTGTVKSEEEKKAIEDKATEIAGAGKVTNEITVAAK